MVEVTLAHKSPVKGADGGQSAVFVLALDARHFVRIYPAVSRERALFFVLFQIDFICHDFCTAVKQIGKL